MEPEYIYKLRKNNKLWYAGPGNYLLGLSGNARQFGIDLQKDDYPSYEKLVRDHTTYVSLIISTVTKANSYTVTYYVTDRTWEYLVYITYYLDGSKSMKEKEVNYNWYKWGIHRATPKELEKYNIKSY
jgi:hypothetical protein